MSVVCALYQFYLRSSFVGYALLFRCNPQEGEKEGWLEEEGGEEREKGERRID